MIYIISEKTDLVTDLVTEWIRGGGNDFKRCNDDDFIESENGFSKTNIEKIWVRRGTFNFLPNEIFKDYFNRRSILKYIVGEVREYSIYLEYKLKQNLGDNYIGSYTKEVSTNNKLINLDIAKDVGFKTPITRVTSSKKELLSFYRTHKLIITKDLRTPVNIRTRHKVLASNGVELITEKMISNLEDYFAPIFIQKYVEKKYEIRVFVFSKKLYAMAIFSQKDERTKIDYRNFNNEKQNRCVPLILPENIQKKIWIFLDKSDMNTGSIDLIVTPNNDFIFLEINPMGQFHWLSANCNYYIEKDISNFLTA